jgi:hypothetical protein
MAVSPTIVQDLLDAKASGLYTYDTVTAPGGPYTFEKEQPNSVTFTCGKDEMLKVSDKGFWVRGVRVEQDDKEAEVVYNSFKKWLVWAQLNDLR